MIEGVPGTRRSLFCRLQECLQKKDVAGGRRLHALMLFAGLDSLSCLADHLIRLFASRDTLLEASTIFCNIANPTVHTWHAIISAHVRLEEGEIALRLYHNMLRSGIHSPLSIFLLVLKACGSTQALIQGRIIHQDIIESRLESDVVVSSTLLYMYAKCGSLSEARALFDLMVDRTGVSWNAMIAGYVHCGQGGYALELFAKMQHEDIMPDQVTFSCILKACGMFRAIEQGRQIHQRIIRSGFDSSLYIASSLVDMYAKSGSLDEAREVFLELPMRSVVLWNTMISGYVHHGHGHSALELFMKMQQEGAIPDNTTFSSILKACGDLRAKEQGNLLHALILESQYMSDVVILGALVDMYVKCANLEDARRVFDNTPCRGKVTWGAMIAGYVQREHGILALELFEEMQSEGIQPDNAMYSCILKACGLIRAIEVGKLLHNQIIRRGLETDVVVGSTIIDMYNKCGSLDDGIRVFDRLPKQDVVSWSTMIAGYVQHGSDNLTLRLFERMQEEHVKPDKFTFSCMLKAFRSTKAIEQGKCLHDQIIRNGLKSDEFLGIGLIDMYAKCGNLEEASHVFESLEERNAVAWGAMIVGHAQHGNIPSALKYFYRMQEEDVKPDEIILACLLKACSSSGQVKSMHDQIRQSGFLSHVGIGNTLIDMYGKTGSLYEARKVFDGLPHKDVISWNTMIAGYIEHGLSLPAFELYEKMQQEIPKLDSFTFSSIMKACCQAGAFDNGNLIYEQIIRRGLESDLVMQRTIIEMYAECGSLEDARKVFDNLPRRDAALWGAMIAAYTQHDSCKLAFKLLEEMQEQGLKPDGSTHTNVLAAYSHSGELEEGKRHFKSIKEESGIKPSIEHFNCAVDLLGRAGHLREAEELLQTMPFPPDVIGWTSFLTACRTHGNIGLGKEHLEESQKGLP